MPVTIGRRELLAALGGAAAAWPLVARAQQPAMPVIGFMSARSPEDSVHLLEAFRRGLKEGGFVEGENVAIQFRWARGDYSRVCIAGPGGRRVTAGRGPIPISIRGAIGSLLSRRGNDYLRSTSFANMRLLADC
jgi:hypothetical protein